MTGATSTKEEITLNGFNQISAELFEHPLSLPEHDKNSKLVSLQGSPSVVARQVNGKIEQNQTSFIEKTKMTAKHKNDSAQCSPNSTKTNGVKHQVQSENADGAKNYSNGKTSPLKIIGGSKLTNFLLPKRTKVKGFQSSTSTNISLPTGNAVNGNNSTSHVNVEGRKVLTASSSGSSRTGSASRSNSVTRRTTQNGYDEPVWSETLRGSSSPSITKAQKATTFNDELVTSKKRSFVPSFKFAMGRRYGKDAKPASRNGSVVSLSDNRPSSSSNTFINYNKAANQNNKTGGVGFASRMKSLVTNRSKNVTSTKVINTKVENSSELSVTSAPRVTKGFRKSRKKAHESQSFDMNDGVGISHTDAAKSASEPSLAAQFSASNHRNRGDAFVREASSVASLTSSSTTAGSKTNKKSGSKKLFRKNRNAKILPSSGQNSASDKSYYSSSNAVTTAGGVVLTGVNTYASSYTRKTGMDPRDPIFTLDVRTGNSRQVTPRQRQEIYAMNRVMTRLENDRFKNFCHEKGFKGDLQIEDYDIFM